MLVFVSSTKGTKKQTVPFTTLIAPSNDAACSSELVGHLSVLPNSQVASCSGLFHLCFLSLWHFYLSDHMNTPSLRESFYSNVLHEAHHDIPTSLKNSHSRTPTLLMPFTGGFLLFSTVLDNLQ